jgi:hypothetical protein
MKLKRKCLSFRESPIKNGLLDRNIPETLCHVPNSGVGLLKVLQLEFVLEILTCIGYRIHAHGSSIVSLKVAKFLLQEK